MKGILSKKAATKAATKAGLPSKAAIQAATKAGLPSKCKKLFKPVQHSKLGDGMLIWLIKEKALKPAELMHIPDFIASDGWPFVVSCLLFIVSFL